ncbi:MAG: T9SS type A sorting domain-containing protein [Bacteroidales bacterium]|nr:T9SS type A sorting domain-containing protein [Bacteroidales bacterium]
MKLNSTLLQSIFAILLIFFSIKGFTAPLPIPWGEEVSDSLGPNSGGAGNIIHSTFHYDLVKLLAVKAGFSMDTAEIIARYSALTDQINPQVGYPSSPPSLTYSASFPTWDESVSGTERFSPAINSFGENPGVYWHCPLRDPSDTLTGSYVYAPYAYPNVTDTNYRLAPYYWHIPFAFTLNSIEEWAIYGTSGIDGLPQDAPDTVKYFDVSSATYKPVPKGSLIALSVFLHALADTYSHEQCMMQDTLRSHPPSPDDCDIYYHYYEIPYLLPSYAYDHTDRSAQAIWRVLREYKRIHNITTPALWTVDNNGFEDGDGIPDELEDNYNSNHSESFIEKWKSPATINLNPLVDTVINHYDHTTLRIQLVDDELNLNGIETEKKIENYFHINSLFPNPAENSIEVNFSMEKPGEIVATIYDQSGKNMLIRNYPPNNQYNSTFTFDLKKFPAGIYILRLESRGNSTGMMFIKK